MRVTADGVQMAVEACGEAARAMSLVASRLSALAPPSDDPPASRVEGRPDAPSPQAGDGEVGVWWAVFDKHGRPDELWSTEAGARQSAARDMPQWAPYAVLPVVAQSELARVRKEREEWRDTAIVRQGQIDHLRTQLAAMTRERDDARQQRDEKDHQLTQCYARLEEALQQRDALAKRFEEGQVLWMDDEGDVWDDEPSPTEVEFYGPFTRGRFVKDQGEGQG